MTPLTVIATDSLKVQVPRLLSYRLAALIVTGVLDVLAVWLGAIAVLVGGALAAGGRRRAVDPGRRRGLQDGRHAVGVSGASWICGGAAAGGPARRQGDAGAREGRHGVRG